MLISADRGQSWHALPVNADVAMTDAQYDDVHGQYLVGVANGQILRSGDGGVAWTAGSTGLTNYITRLYVDAQSKRIFALTS